MRENETRERISREGAERRGDKRRRVHDVMGGVYRRRGISSINACRLKTPEIDRVRDTLHNHFNTTENPMPRISLNSTSMTSVGGMKLLVGEYVGFRELRKIYI